MILVAAACIIFNSYFQQPNKHLPEKPKPHVTKSLLKPFKASGLPFEMNGMNLQYQYTVKKDQDAENPKEFQLLAKKLIDINQKTIVCDFKLDTVDEQSPIINLSDITKEKTNSKNFDDVNFDGYKDIREVCKPCSRRNVYEKIYLFNPHTKKFYLWTSVLGVGVMLDKKNKTVTCFENNGGGEIIGQEIKFADHGVELYRKEVSCTMFKEKKLLYKLTYDKYVGKKLVAHKTKIATDPQIYNEWDLIEYIEKDKK